MHDELIALYCAETGHSPRIVAPFVAAGIEPPRRSTTDRRGFTAAEVAIIDAGSVSDA